MALFQNDLIAALFILLIVIGLYVINKVIGLFLQAFKKIPMKQKNLTKFILRILSIFIIAYLIIEGFPSFNNIPAEYQAILTGSISTALAFVSSEIFANFMAGILLFVIDPLDIGDIVKIKGYKGVVLSITLTRVVLDTFDNVKVDIANKDIMNSSILNYTKKIKYTKSYIRFKKQVIIPQYKGRGHLGGYLFNSIDEEEKELKLFHENINQDENKIVHMYNFSIKYPIKRFRILVDKTDKVCVEYKNKFGFKPRFHIMDLGFEITVKFRIMTTKAKALMDYQPEFAKKIFEIVRSES
ncbi:MAG: mechanosensitive ion channel [Candidatus Lokiarchaeota archaeon]|nr:mechanosensitive ion channel [Candidatus Lokiarchaeota archaeon]